MRSEAREGDERWLDEVSWLLAHVRRVCRERPGQPGRRPAVACPACGRRSTSYGGGHRAPIWFTCPHCGLKIIQ